LDAAATRSNKSAIGTQRRCLDGTVVDEIDRAKAAAACLFLGPKAQTLFVVATQEEQATIGSEKSGENFLTGFVFEKLIFRSAAFDVPYACLPIRSDRQQQASIGTEAGSANWTWMRQESFQRVGSFQPAGKVGPDYPP
jgi:hypothetical protein